MRIAPRHGFALLTSLFFGLLAGVCEYFALYLDDVLAAYLKHNEGVGSLLTGGGVPQMAATLQILCWFAFPLFFAAAILSLVQKPLALRVIRGGLVLVYAFVAYYAVNVLDATSVFVGPQVKPAGLEELDSVQMFFLRWHHMRWANVALLVAVALHVLSLRSRTLFFYTGIEPAEPTTGDRLIENVRTHGEDPRFRKSMLASAFTHFAVLVLIPFILSRVGCVDPYLVPKGEGNPVVAIVQVVKPQKKKPKKKLVANTNSAILFNFPELEDSNVLEEVSEQTELTHVADTNRVHGAMGAGGGKKGGWPDGSDKAVFRFIRLQYRGADWDDGMPENHGADRNFMAYFKKTTGFRVAEHSESNRITDLRKYDKGYAPPFVYMTGTDRLDLSQNEIRILREYLNEGGMLFADCGYVPWDRNFRSLMKALFPGEQLLTIADDDPIFQYPFSFPNGAPPLWHHGGNRALGIKIKNRWAVFYHPGDINDAWKTGNSGVDPAIAERAFQVGVNIVYHAFTNYLRETRKYRK